MLSFFKETLDNLSQIAGALVAIQEELERESGDAPSSIPVTPERAVYLNSLPLAIKSGCNSRDSLAWFRFGVRLRRPAHLLARLYRCHRRPRLVEIKSISSVGSSITLLSSESGNIENVTTGERSIVAAIQGILKSS